MSMTEVHSAPGEVTVKGDDLKVVFRRRYARSIEKVWAALTVPERLAAWLAGGEIEMRDGGAIHLKWENGNEMTGKVVAYDPPRTFAWTWPLGGVDTVVRFDLEADGDGCWLTLTHSGLSPRPGGGGGVRAGWHAHLEGLLDAIDGHATRWDTIMARKNAVDHLYPALSA